MNQYDRIVVSGCTDETFNGSYNYAGLHDTKPYYLKGTQHVIIYRSMYMPYNYSAAYYIEKIYGSGNSSVFSVPKYTTTQSDLTSGTITWSSMLPLTSGETASGTAYYDQESSSSSSSSSVDSSSSSSRDSSSSSSSSSSVDSSSSSSSSE